MNPERDVRGAKTVNCPHTFEKGWFDFEKMQSGVELDEVLDDLCRWVHVVCGVLGVPAVFGVLDVPGAWLS